MAEEEDPWGFDDSADAGAEAVAGDAAAPSADSVAAPAAPAADGGAPAEQAAVEEAEEDSRPTAEDDHYRKPVQLYKHWVRPQFLQYKYMYNYRTNYYDDVIDYLDKRQSGVNRDIPRAQTWAERVLRTNSRIFDEETVADHERYSIKTLGLDSSTLPFTYRRSAAQKSLRRSKTMMSLRSSVILDTKA